MKVIVAGSRDVIREDVLAGIRKSLMTVDWKITEIVHGGARGVDQIAGDYFHGKYPIKVFPADWGRHGRGAGHIRNLKMAQYADALIAIWDRTSPGTKAMIRVATREKIRIHVHILPKGRS